MTELLTMTATLETLYKSLYGAAPLKVEPIKAHASERKIFRLTGPKATVCGVVNSNIRENETFIYFAEQFQKVHLPVPTVLIQSKDGFAYLLEDLGDSTLYDVLNKTRTDTDPFPEPVIAHYQKALSYLARFQVDGAKQIDFSRCFQAAEFGSVSMISDMTYFLESFIGKTKVPLDQKQLQIEFSMLAKHLLEAPHSYFLYRDFQARNIMVSGQQIYFIDFQGGRQGALQYDVVSLLYQSSVHIPEDIRNELIFSYIDALKSLDVPYSEDEFRKYLDRFIIIRMMQVLGTYGTQGLERGKDYFAKNIPLAVDTLYKATQREEFFKKLPHLSEIIERIMHHDIFGSRLAH